MLAVKESFNGLNFSKSVPDFIILSGSKEVPERRSIHVAEILDIHLRGKFKLSDECSSAYRHNGRELGF